MDLRIVLLTPKSQFTVLPNTADISAVDLLRELPFFEERVSPILEDARFEFMGLLIAFVKGFDFRVNHAAISFAWIFSISFFLVNAQIDFRATRSLISGRIVSLIHHL